MATEPSPFETASIPRSTIERSAGIVRALLASTRIALGWVFLWAFLDKTLGLGFSTPTERAWIHGGSPTFGFLAHGTSGPFSGLFQAVAGHPVVDVLFMVGLLGVGLALVSGAGTRLAALAGSLMLVLMWLAALPPENNPLVDDHVVYPLVLWLLVLFRADEVLGLGRWWKRRPIVQRFPILG